MVIKVRKLFKNYKHWEFLTFFIEHFCIKTTTYIGIQTYPV